MAKDQGQASGGGGVSQFMAELKGGNGSSDMSWEEARAADVQDGRMEVVGVIKRVHSISPTHIETFRRRYWGQS